MVRRLRHTITALLGLFAILVATLAPTVSEVLAASRAATVADAALCAAHDTSDDTSHDADAAPHDMHGKACDYCGLLAHAPPLPAAKAACALAAAATEHRAAVRFETLRLPFVFRSAQPRAPPAVSLT